MLNKIPVFKWRQNAIDHFCDPALITLMGMIKDRNSKT